MEETVRFELMEVTIEENQPGLLFGYKNQTGGSFMGRDNIEKLRDWLTQWLKENPKKVERFMNCYPGGIGDTTLYETEEAAHEAAGGAREACIPISYHIGEGLEKESEE